jgi:16S rRNA (cytosine1402-N4)-methyltransferase
MTAEMTAEMTVGHVPVMADEVVQMLAPAAGSRQVDATLGGGGHAERILEASDPDGRLLGLDADGAAIARVRARLAQRFGARLQLRQANFRDLGSVAAEEGFAGIDGCLFDLGLSSFQLADADRGFGFRTSGALDMRFDTNRGVPAAELIATLDATELTALFRRYGEEPFAGRIARAIVEARRTAPLRTADELAALVARVTPSRAPGRRRVHPATRVFQALRIAVNEELEAVGELLDQAVRLLDTEGRLVVISYHSLEDRIVKNRFRDLARGEVDPITGRTLGATRILEVLTKKPLRPSEAEVDANPRARSARLRAARRL